ncbi:MAG: methylmalonyl-CoA carboxyltransferase [Thermoleophilia bacterium]|nr:methylmalonyl-CoA carboxyltransferase [Thermoleophilia bacterium]
MSSAVATGTEAPPGHLSPRVRLESLCDESSFRPIRSAVLSGGLGERAQPGDGVIAGSGLVGGCPIFCYCQDPGFFGGSLGETHAETIVRTMNLAGKAGAPVVGFIESGGARLQEGHAALAGYGRIFRASVELSRKVPQLSVISGISAGGGAYSPALTDFVLMTRDARLFLTGPKVVADAVGEQVSMEELGGPSVHGANGVCQLVAGDETEAIERVRQLLDLLPRRIGSPADVLDSAPPLIGDPGETVPANPRQTYDVRRTVESILDEETVLEIYERWGSGMYTGLGRLGGRSVGVVANQPRRFGGVIDAEAAEKSAAFINTCDRFGIPLIVLVDTPGFMPGLRQEHAGVIRHGASLLRAFAGATVPKLTVVMRKAFGGAAITMNSRDLGADMVFAWPGAQIGIMSANQAVGIVNRRELAGSGEAARVDLATTYAEQHLTAVAAASSGFVDEVIEPRHTRESLIWTLGSMVGTA